MDVIRRGSFSIREQPWTFSGKEEECVYWVKQDGKFWSGKHGRGM